MNSRVDIKPRVLPLHHLDFLDGRGGGREVPADVLLDPFDPVGPDPVGAGGQGARVLPGSLLPLPGQVVVLALGVREEEVAAGDVGGQRALTPSPASLLRDLLGELEGTLVQELDQGRTGPGRSAASGGVLDLLQPRPVPREVRVRRQVARHAGSLEELPRCDDLGRREILALRVRRPLRLLGRERCGQDEEEREDVHGRGAGGVGGEVGGGRIPGRGPGGSPLRHPLKLRASGPGRHPIARGAPITRASLPLRGDTTRAATFPGNGLWRPAPPLASRCQAWKCQVSPGWTMTVPTGRGSALRLTLPSRKPSGPELTIPPLTPRPTLPSHGPSLSLPGGHVALDLVQDPGRLDHDQLELRRHADREGGVLVPGVSGHVLA